MKVPIKKILAGILIFLSTLIIITIGYKLSKFGNTGIDELQFNLLNSSSGANYSTFLNDIIHNILPFTLLLVILLFPFVNLYKDKEPEISHKSKKRIRKFAFWSYKKINQHLIMYSIIIFIGSAIYASLSLKLDEYIIAKSKSSVFIENHYVNPETVDVTFPDNKRNLIYVHLESMENTVFSKENGGASEISLIPELEQIAVDENNINFSGDIKANGIKEVYGTTWTVAGLVSQSAGIPILIMPSIDMNSLGEYRDFLPGAYSLGEILEKEGYYQQLLIGSDASFGGRDKYYSQHGNYNIFDYKTAKEKKLIPENYKVWWGYEDNKLFDYAKDELSRISKLNQPFNFQMLTADTHFVDGYLDPSCEEKFDNKYKNVYACSSKKVNEFIEWVKDQDFYDNTTIIVSGDHLGMQTEFFDEIIGKENYERNIYNVIINSAKVPIINQARIFTSFDIFPTTLSSIGANLSEDQLGLGVDLFSSSETLAEKYGLDFINDELQKRSQFYKDNILIKAK